MCRTRKLEQRLGSYCLYDNAARNWGHHARISQIDGHQCILNFLECEAKASVCGQAILEGYKDHEGVYSEIRTQEATSWHTSGIVLAIVDVGGRLGRLIKAQMLF
ncbi:uncharacterized protein BDW43DRAFT_270668 [Aspergillus alliaceus]|uniref:uncharacterized protein n=1 Tax=Petromyces alliaceus TaxID=209559 RepID=UPI0012A4C483|nr:uncharacterized protein BDW43DRAFT_270668 [Aspergillus alliaceus]KAB8235551.1 hypothetical protein BDW43DRAFT_270668 [Aspergillus alliaceus]